MIKQLWNQFMDTPIDSIAQFIGAAAAVGLIAALLYLS